MSHLFINTGLVLTGILLLPVHTISQVKTYTAGVIIRFNDGIGYNRQKCLLTGFPLLQLPGKTEDYLLPGVALALFKEKNISDSVVDRVLIDIKKMDEVVFANPVHAAGDRYFSAVLGEFYVKLFSEDDYPKLEILARETGTKILGNYEYIPSVYIISADKNSKGNAGKMAAIFSASKLFRYASPNMMFSIDNCIPNDPYYNRQWAIENTGAPMQYNGTPDADMDIDSAWTITSGDSTIKVAVLDSGVDTLHPDLVNNMLPGFDATGNNSNGYPNTTYPEDGHGTSVAGIIAATADNSIGVAGIAYHCKIIPVRIFYYMNFGGTIVPFSTNQWGADGINWAWQVAEADVLSNSWGLPDSIITMLGIDTAFSNDALNNAISNGRNGKGLPALFSAGNSPDTFVLWPASLPATIAVAATTMCDELKTMNDCSPENFWASNHGTGLDISAPGVRIATTDIRGVKGFSGSDYFLSFNGTSAACPNAAGVMALILSANKNITSQQARQIISTTCDKAGGYSYYPGSTYGTWSMELGYGRVNAYNAVKTAMTDAEDIQNGKNPEMDYFIYKDKSGTLLLHYSLPASGHYSIEIFDIIGRKVKTVANEIQYSGTYQTDISSFLRTDGIYFVRLIAGEINYSESFLITK